MRRLAVLLGVLLVGSGPAAAHWVYSDKPSAFGDKTLHFAFTVSDAYGFGLRCRGSSFEAVYMIPGTLLDSEFYETANRTKPRLRVRVDDSPIVDIDATLREEGDNTWVEGRVDPGLFQSVQSAKKRIAVVLELLGENYHENSFAARGSTSAMKRLVAGCGLD